MNILQNSDRLFELTTAEEAKVFDNLRSYLDNMYFCN